MQNHAGGHLTPPFPSRVPRECFDTLGIERCYHDDQIRTWGLTWTVPVLYPASLTSLCPWRPPASTCAVFFSLTTNIPGSQRQNCVLTPSEETAATDTSLKLSQ
ncbi:hypothetical protein, unlikely [Trypanosoma brucei gambiense DAL972]|uniref:Uncharacterized protein n=1 Tax=Trypanosoma brucei gambiense (strain MHOM/CI/86/DAL972) TaxID=679716 RepID=D0A1I6_TRYB9|nr:hypothetical protein, unlikely [Trypanosoma brucei gambiense DAL972]CBH15128.1 hypothetical protein, unlikely [Trypanosoma brucei gambiense DAL972]|eukprot:XP_011777394.1 hypothetical protein, unlikely [Trypanosoma brucei gambiense DAL972]